MSITRLQMTGVDAGTPRQTTGGLATETPIPTPTGWTTVGALKPGDQVVDRFGKPCAVTIASSVQTGRQCDRVVFSDGSEVVTDRDHVWSVSSQEQRLEPRRVLTRSQRWPGHAVLAKKLTALPVRDPGCQSTVRELEAELGGQRVPLLRRLANLSRFESVGKTPDRPGVYGARIYRRSELIAVLLAEVTSPAPTWRMSEPHQLSTGKLAELLSVERQRWAIQVTDPIELPEQELPIDPWLLGYWLGDGHKACAAIATADTEVLDRIEALGYRVTHYARFNYGVSTRGHGTAAPNLLAGLRSLDLLHNKHAPPLYLRASRSQREEFLAGLLDADGTCNSRTKKYQVSGQVSFTNTNWDLVAATSELAASLGLIPRIRQSRTSGDVEGGKNSVAQGSALQDTWLVRFTPDRQVFGIARKQNKLAPSLIESRRNTTSHRYVADVIPVEPVPVRCVAVDSPSQHYLSSEGFIATPNCRDEVGSLTINPSDPVVLKRRLDVDDDVS